MTEKTVKPMKSAETDLMELPVLPLRDVVVFPHMVIPLFVGREKSVRALDIAMEGNKKILLVAQRSPDVDEPGAGDLYTPADPDADIDTFDWDEPGSTWWDQRLDAYFESRTTPPRAVALRADEFGGFRLSFDDGAFLDVFPNSAPSPHVETEFWRLVTPGVAGPHVIADTSGVRVQQQS